MDRMKLQMTTSSVGRIWNCYTGKTSLAAEADCIGMHTVYNRHAKTTGKQSLLSTQFCQDLLLFKIYVAAMLKIQADLSFTVPQRKKKKKKQRTSCEQNLWHMVHGCALQLMLTASC